MKTTYTQNSLAVVLAAVSITFAATAARAAEGGMGHYAPGSFASYVDVLPDKPGFAAFNYFTYYNGSASGSQQFPVAGQIDLSLGASSYADTLGGFWVAPFQILGANYSAGFALPLVWTDITAQTSGVGRSIGVSSSVNGLGDIEFWPVALGWTAMDKDLHVDFFGGIYAPSGNFDTGRLANQGLGYWTYEPGLLVSYLGQKNGLEFTTYLGYDINSTNGSTDYRSGQVFHADVTVAQHLPLGKGFLGIGANAFYLKQTTGDSGSGARLGGFEESTSGVGPVLSYAMQFQKTAFAAQITWLPQTNAENTLKGNYLWFKLGFQF